MSPTARRNRSAPLLTAVVLGLIVLLGLLAFVAGGGDDAAAEAATVTGDALPEFVPGGEDAAAGMEAPTVTGTSLDGENLTFDPGETGPAVVVFLAHWCPACNAEVPVLQELVDEDAFDDVELMTVHPPVCVSVIRDRCATASLHSPCVTAYTCAGFSLAAAGR